VASGEWRVAQKKTRSQSRVAYFYQKIFINFYSRIRGRSNDHKKTIRAFVANPMTSEKQFVHSWQSNAS